MSMLIEPWLAFTVAIIGYFVIWLAVNLFVQPYLENCTEENAKNSFVCKAIKNITSENEKDAKNNERNVELS